MRATLIRSAGSGNLKCGVDITILTSSHHDAVHQLYRDSAISVVGTYMQRRRRQRGTRGWPCLFTCNTIDSRCLTRLRHRHNGQHIVKPSSTAAVDSRHNVGVEKLECCGYSTVKKLWSYVYSFRQNTRTWQTDEQTPRDNYITWRIRCTLCKALRTCL